MGRIVRSADFERVLGTPPAHRTAHFAVHYAPGTVPAELSTSVTTTSEQPVDELHFDTRWFGVVVPAGTPRPVIERLAGWFNQITNSDDAKQFLARAALDAFPGSPEQMAALLKVDTERWANYVRMAKIEPQ